MLERKIEEAGWQEEEKNTKSILHVIPKKEYFKRLFWEGTFDDYLDIVVKEPKVTRTACQRLFDALMHYETEKKWASNFLKMVKEKGLKNLVWD